MKIVLMSLMTILTISLAASMAKAVTWEVEIENFAFVPQNLQIQVGDVVEWRNRDNVGHTSTSDDGVWNSGTLLRDQVFSFTFTQGGSYPYHCTTHPFMTGSINVQGPTSADDPQTPGKFEIAPNYPNPFNARTTIGFSIPQAGHATVEIFNLLGQRVETLLDAEMAAGTHRVTWVAEGAQSGVFFYRVAFEGQALTGRMTLLK